ncbi:peptide transporter [Herbaspirillum sp. LeCh32-8]|uniref:peptide transporter n=1 Tax=Herbaspirillum sp. LeCh32-8 TaxID=2821356 RepID=UPI001AEB013B|nr:peptide transporter [Herbaspirillum sp. LeCh32-8]MBP0598812.1 peptide transporter [Herbaspirillum sp. LeCh32-8]
MSFSLEKFEAHVYRREHDAALGALHTLLHDINLQSGMVSDKFSARLPRAVEKPDANPHIWVRIASAISALFADDTFQIPAEWQHRLLGNHRWFAPIFAASAFRNADHLLRALNRHESGELSKLVLADRDLLKFCLLYSPESDVNLDLDALWKRDKVLAASLCLGLLSPRFQGSRAAHAQREKLLPWLAQKLWEIEDLDQLPIDLLHGVYMYCSYASHTGKHDIKKPINALLHRRILRAGFSDIGQPPHSGPGKPVMMVLFESFNSGHSIHRTHSLTIDAARAQFRVVGIGYPQNIDDKAKEVFDEFIALKPDTVQNQLTQIQAESLRLGAQVFYMPSVGMAAISMYLANLRIAPLQVMALGHPATSHGRAIDYVVVEEDYVGDPACFSEKLLRLPSDGMPYRPSSALTRKLAPPSIEETAPKVVKIAVCSTTMKLTPQFLDACLQIAQRADTPVHFHFLLGDGIGLIFAQAQRVVRQVLGELATIHARQPYEDYLALVAGCDMFINPFPFGNTNGIVDAISVGLVGVCKVGPEVHEHIDHALLKRLGMPGWLSAPTVETYVQAAVKLANAHGERTRLRRRLSGPDKLDVFFKGRPEIMGQQLLALLQRRHQDVDDAD